MTVVVDIPLYLLKTSRMIMIKTKRMKRRKWRAMNKEKKNVGLRLEIKQVHKILMTGMGFAELSRSMSSIHRM